MRLENWSVRGKFDPYVLPECQVLRLKGNVYGHPEFEDGKVVWTSWIQSVNGRTIETMNSEYELGEVEPEYLQWCKDNDHHLPEGDNPIRWNQ